MLTINNKIKYILLLVSSYLFLRIIFESKYNTKVIKIIIKPEIKRNHFLKIDQYLISSFVNYINTIKFIYYFKYK